MAERLVKIHGGYIYTIDKRRNNVMHPEAAIYLPYATVESSMRRWRRAFHPPAPESLNAYGLILLDPQWHRMLEYERGRITVTTLVAVDGTTSVVFGNRDFINLISDATEIFVDATFKVVPAVNGAYQLLTIMATKFNHALPFVWAIMGRKTKSAYDSVFAYVREVLAPHLIPTAIMTDFERALSTALIEVYPEGTPHGCFFHYCQALYRKARSLRVTEAIRHDDEGQKLLRKCMALAFLPAQAIPDEFASLVGLTTPALRAVFHDFFAYYQLQWLERVTPTLFSVNGLLRRTNNCMESYHRVLLDRLTPHPNIWDFTKKIVALQSAAHADFLTLQQGRAVSRSPKISYLISNVRLFRMWRHLAEERITRAEFMEQASFLVSGLARDLGNAAFGRDEDFDEENLVRPALLQDPDAAREAELAAPEPIPRPDGIAELDDMAARPAAPVPFVIPIPVADAIPAPGPVPEFRLHDHFMDDLPPVPDLNGGASDNEEGDAGLIPRQMQEPDLPVDDNELDTMCVVCRAAQSTCLSIPCYHMVMCGRCANEVIRIARHWDDGDNPQFGRLRCPFCNQDAAQFRRVRMPLA